ncbi:Vomp family autotransporter [Bartonella sp. AU55XJBT]|uniref:Vomp family autotransporter n=1 Tax=Bartonella sp. AU55XJBT TaxID=3019091 RepID=UPI002362C725|nr:Vomp family autotransporter [Bartonella sp. AU55XJBT]
MGTIIVAFLSNTSPIYAKNFDIIEQLLQVLEKATAIYSQGNNRNVFSDYNRYSPHTGFFDNTGLSKSSYLTMITTAIMSRVNASSGYADFLITMLSEKGKTAVNVLDKDSSSTQKKLESSIGDNHGSSPVLLNTLSSSEEKYPIQVNERTSTSARAESNSTAAGSQANAAGQKSVAIGFKTQSTGSFAITVGAEAQATKEDSIAIGYMAHALGKSSTAIGSEYHEKGQDDYTTAKGDYSTALGAISKALGYGSTAIGHRAYAMQKDAVSIGFYSKANAEESTVLGVYANAEKKDSVAVGYKAAASAELSSALGAYTKATALGSVSLGDSSVADVSSGIFGFDPLFKKATTNANAAWKSGHGAVSVGSVDKTRQITKVAAGSVETDAVNVAQLKSLQAYVDKGWKLSVGGANGKVIGIDGTVDFSTESKNLEITKGEGDNKVKFDMAKALTLESVKVGANTFDATGLIIKDGPKIMTTGIDAGNKKITGIEAGIKDTDAVNFGQLQKIEKEVEQQVVASSFVKQEAETKHITIGKDTEGDKIDIANKNNEKRTLTGIKDGALSAESKEAVTGSQLFETNQKVDTISTNLQTAATNIAKYFGGNAKYEDDKWTDPKFTVKLVKADGNSEETSYTNVAEAFAGVGASITNVQNKVTNDITNKFSELNQNITNITQQVTGDALLWNDEVQAFVARHKKKAEEQDKATRAQENSKITFLLDGIVSKDSTDAITGKQLYSTSNTFATYLDKDAGYDAEGNWQAPSFKVKTVNGEGKEEDNNYTNVAEALSGVGTSFTNIQNEMTKEITNQINSAITTIQGESLIKRDKATNNINIGKETEGGVINIANKNGEVRTLSGVKEAMEVDEAINKGQFDKGMKGLTEDLQFENSFAVHYDKKSNDNGNEADYTNITLGKNNIPTALHNVADGIISDKSHDAITGGQIYKIGGDIAKFLGGDTAFNNGAFTEPIYTLSEISKEGQVTDKSFSDVGKAFTGLDSNIKNVNDLIKEVSQGIAQDSLLWSKQDGAFVASHGVGDTRKESKITHILAGDITAVSTDAVIGKQLYELHQTLATYLGGGSEYDKDKEWKAPDFKIQQFGENGKPEEKTYHDVASAFEGVNNSVMNMHDKITNQISQVVRDSLVKQEKATDLITIGKATDGIEINIANKDDEDRTLSGVKAATKDNEAVNKGQLDTSIKDANNELTNKFNDFTKNITNITQQVKGDALLWDKEEKAFIADHGEGSAKTKSKITHLLDGAISSDSTDAITGSQLYSVGSGISASLGGGASYEGGSWTTPTFTVYKFDIKGNATQEDYKTVSDALSGLSNSLTNIHNEMNNEIAHVKGESLIKQDDKTKLITVGGEKEGTIINIANKNKEDRTLSGVKAATQDNEAVNKAQLDKLDKKIESTNSFVVFYDKQSDGTVTYKSVTFGGKNKEPVALHNVADGALTQESHDAINGGQITKIFQQIVKYFGGSAAFKEGVFTGPIYKLLSISENGAVGQKEHDNIVSAFEGLDTNIKNVNQRIKEVSEGISNDSLLWDKNKEAYVALHGEGETRENSKITYLKDGDITANSSDAVNGSQLYSLNEQLATYFGGGAGYDKQGNWQAPNFKIKQFGEDGVSEEKSYSNISDALSEVGNSFTNIQNKMTHEISKIESENLVKQDEKTKLITIGGEKDGREISIANSASGVRSLSGVKAGLLTAESTEAVNGFQLYSVINALSRYFSGDAGYKDGQWLAPNFKVAQFTADGVVSKKEDYTNVASAFEGVNESMTNINNRIHDFEQSVFSGGLNWSETEKAFDAHHKGQDSKIKHVADGEISEGSKEAVNGSQLWQTNKKVEEVENHVNMIDKQVKDIASVADIAVKYDKGNDGKKKNKVTLVGVSESDPVLIDNVADGRIESGSKEAVTGGQLHDYTDQQMRIVLSDAKKYTDERFNDVVTNTVNNIVHDIKSYTDIKFEALRYEIKEIRKESRQAAAIGLAVSNLSYEETPGSVSLSIGMGMWRNQSAFAVGAGYVSENGRIRSNISATSSGNHWGVGAGLRVKLN